MYTLLKTCFFLLCGLYLPSTCLGLFPQDSESREIKLLDGLWNFRTDNSTSRDQGLKERWYQKQLKKSGDIIYMPVPSSYNDITQDMNIRDFIGWVWYDRDFFVPISWKDNENQRVVLRFESCHYYCMVWVNGKQLMEHDGGHLPFEGEVTDLLYYGESNLVTVAANNTLTPTTLPPGSVEYLHGRRYPPEGVYVQNLQMDFFNYAGIHRPVKLYITPTTFLHDITLNTDYIEDKGSLNFTAGVAQLEKPHKDNDGTLQLTYNVFDADGLSIASISGENLLKGNIEVPNINLWWPVDMGHKPGYLYTLKITVIDTTQDSTDIYRLKFGFRTVKVTDKAFLINNVPFYFKGFGMHEDAEIRGKGLDLPTIMKNFNLIDWIGANSFRTSHYPYADEILYLADERGIVVIDESPGVGIKKENMNEENIVKHKNVMKEMVHRDKNHPSVVMWSVANEPDSQEKEAVNYFKEVISYTKELDETRPVTFVGHESPYSDKAVKYVDVVCFNHYYAWYHDFGMTDLISYQVEADIKLWRNITGKPMMYTEYGADAIAGVYQNPPVMFTEDYQDEAIKKYFPVFDQYKKQYFIGEMIWNFADFATAQSQTRVAGNKKGIFTRNRQPKRAAYTLKNRYKKLSSINSEAFVVGAYNPKDTDNDDGRRDTVVVEQPPNAKERYYAADQYMDDDDNVDLITVR